MARITEFEGLEALKKKAYGIFRDVYRKRDRRVELQEYIRNISERIESSLDNFSDTEKVKEIISSIAKKSKTENVITIGFSHGDLQPGNIWIENKTKKIYIIDWESWGERSIWYDKEVLFGGLRPGSISTYLKNKKEGADKNIVILEDILFQLNELNSLPNGSGIKRFNDYLN